MRVVNKIPCECGKVYIEETGRSMEVNTIRTHGLLEHNYPLFQSTVFNVMADGHGNSAANTQDISGEVPRISALQQEDITSDSLVEYLKVNKSKFSWAGTFSELIEFANKYLHLGNGVKGDQQ